MAGIPDDWSYKLGKAFIDAAVTCATCARSWVSDGTRPEQPPPGCECQLVAVVSEGWANNGARCGVLLQAEVRLVLDLCTVVFGKDEVPNAARVNAQAQKNAATRMGMMKGIRSAWISGALAAPVLGLPAQIAGCGSITPGPWVPTRSTGGVARWEALWRFSTDY